MVMPTIGMGRVAPVRDYYTASEIIELVAKRLLPQWQIERTKLDRIDLWLRWNHESPHQPRTSQTQEYRELQARSITPWLSLVVTSVAQALYVNGYRAADSGPDDPAPLGWRMFQANGMDGRQSAIYRAALGYGYAYGKSLPGTDPLTREKMPAMRGVSPRRMLAFYQDPAEDDTPQMAIQVDLRPGRMLRIRVYDDQWIYHLSGSLDSDKLEYVTAERHSVGVCPIVRFSNMLDLEGRCDGEVEPYISTAGRIDQTTFDRLVVQRFSSWIVRTIAGMNLTDTADATGETPQASKLRLKVEDILVAEDNDTKFGSLPASDLHGFIEAHEADVKALAAVTQTPAHELLGTMANLSAEALAAARASLTAKVTERQHSFGESWEQWLRLGSAIAGDTAGAADFSSQVRWEETEIRSLAQAADALGKLAQMLNVPDEILWEKIPGFTQQDVERARKLVKEGGGVTALLEEIARGASSTPGTFPPPAGLPAPTGQPVAA